VNVFNELRNLRSKYQWVSEDCPEVMAVTERMDTIESELYFKFDSKLKLLIDEVHEDNRIEQARCQGVIDGIKFALCLLYGEKEGSIQNKRSDTHE